MGLALLIDFGSTYTKVTAVDLNAGLFLGRSQAPSTVSTNVLDGFEAAERQLESQLGFSIDFRPQFRDFSLFPIP